MFKPKTLLYAAGALGGGYVVLNSMSDFKTPGIRNIEARHSSAGGADSHTPAGGTKMGDKDAVGTDSKGVGSKHFKEKFADQNPKAGEINKKWNRTQYGTDGGKPSS